MEFRTILRIVQLVVVVVLLVLWYALGAYAHITMFVCGTVLGYVIIYAVLLAHEFMDFKESLVFTLIGAILFIICGGITIGTMPHHGNARNTHIFAAVAFFYDGVLFLVTFILEILEIKNNNSGSSMIQ